MELKRVWGWFGWEELEDEPAHAVGEMASAFGTLHNTNFQGTKDVVEEVVYPTFRSFDETSRSLKLLDGVISTMEFRRENMLRKAAEGFGSCTELAARIHRDTDLSYRTAHRVVGNLVLRAFKRGKLATEIDAAMLDESAAEVVGHALDLDDGTVKSALDPTAFVAAHDVPGGPAPNVVRGTIRDAWAALEEDHLFVADSHDALERAGSVLDERVAKLVNANQAS